jgi:hypothetical protein
MLPKFTSEFRPKGCFISVFGKFIIKKYVPYSLQLMSSYFIKSYKGIILSQLKLKFYVEENVIPVVDTDQSNLYSNSVAWKRI